jgi:hypothetical protein
MKGVKKVYVKPIMSVEESDKWAGRMLKAEDCKQVFNEDVDVYDKETGRCLAKFRKGVIPANVQKVAFENLLPAAKATDSRPTANGKSEDGRASKLRVKKDGTISKQVVARGEKINSGVAGYFDRTQRPGFQHCRLTAFNRHHIDKFKAAYPIIKLVDSYYASLMPEYYKKQRGTADKTSKDFVIRGTAFTTLTVNKNYPTAVHKDAGDFKEGFGNLVALRKGKYEGCYFTFVRWGVGFDMQNGDLLMCDVHEWHGNTPMVAENKKVVRLSLVMYYRENMGKCGTMAEELERVKRRKKGDKLN